MTTHHKLIKNDFVLYELIIWRNACVSNPRLWEMFEWHEKKSNKKKTWLRICSYKGVKAKKPSSRKEMPTTAVDNVDVCGFLCLTVCSCCVHNVCSGIALETGRLQCESPDFACAFSSDQIESWTVILFSLHLRVTLPVPCVIYLEKTVSRYNVNTRCRLMPEVNGALDLLTEMSSKGYVILAWTVGLGCTS